MSAATETPQQAARRLTDRQLAKGYVPEALHEYAAADGSPVFWRIRMKHPTEPKLIRPMHCNGKGFVLGEPPAPADGKPLYRLHELTNTDPAFPAWIVEGEKAADALAKLGVTVTTSGAADSAAAADWTALRGRRCIVWPDNDPAGMKYAEAAGDLLRAMGCDVEVLDAAALGLPAKGDAVDWLALHPKASGDDLDALPRTSTAPLMRNAPEPLRRPVPPPEPYPLAELGPILAPAAESLRRVIQAPDAICGAALLAAASLATQGLADVENDGRIHPLSLWMLSVAESGERKSAVDSEAMRAARAYEKELAKAFADETEGHAAEHAQWEAQRDALHSKAKKAQGEGLASALRELGPAPPPPLLPKVTVADFTAEGLAKLLAAGRPTVGAFTDEAALVFGGHGMTKETVTRTAGTLCKLWDNGTLDRVRASEGAVKLWGRRLALHLMAQPIIAERALSDVVLSGQGFLARCLLAWPESTAGTRPYVAESLSNDPALIRLESRLMDLHRRALPFADGERQELRPPALRMTPDAAAVWRTLHDSVERNMARGERFASVKPWASKTPEQCLRIAGVLTMLESPDAQNIDVATIERAAELALWHLNEAARLAGTAELSPEVRDAEALLEWAHATERTLLHSGAALRLGPARIRERERFMQAMGELERAGWAEPVAGGAAVDGAHRRHVWRIAPVIDGTN